MRKNQNTLLIVRTCNWSAHAEERRSQVCLLGNHWMGGPIPEARKIDGSGSWTSTKTFVWTQRWSVGQQRSPGGNWGWELRGEIWAGDLGWSLGVAIWKMMLKSMGKWVGWCGGSREPVSCFSLTCGIQSSFRSASLSFEALLHLLHPSLVAPPQSSALTWMIIPFLIDFPCFSLAPSLLYYSPVLLICPSKYPQITFLKP